MKDFLYFAYGSNMLTERICARCANSICAGRATLAEQRLNFEKPSQDGSGKCAFTADVRSSLEGVLWSINPAQLSKLDDLEGVGHGYERRTVSVARYDGRVIDAQTYYADQSKPGIQPYEWYLALVIAGALQHSLPMAYLAALLRTPFKIDSQTERPTRLQAKDELRSANMLGVLNELKKA